MRDQKRVHREEGVLAWLAGRQHGVAAAWQLHGYGFDKHSISRRLRCGRLHVVHRGVYAVGHSKLTPQGHRMAAVLAGGPGSALSHRAAGAEWQLRRWSGTPSVTTPTWRRSTRGIAFHCNDLPPDEITVLDGIPSTTVPRTLLDLATVLDEHDLVTVLGEAEKRQLSDPLSLPELLRRHRGERGTGRLRTALEKTGYGVPVEALEEAFARFVAERGLPRPELNAHLWIEDRFVSPDCLWRDQRLIVELHSVRHHGTGPAISRDATRDRVLLLAGWRVVHVTWAQLHDPAEAAALERDLRLALGCDP
jgi:very-short-patch-repair endonuclease